MSDLRVTVCSVAMGGWYPRGVARMIDAFAANSSGYEIQAWINVRPRGAPSREVTGEHCYAYCAKPYAVRYAADNADIVILLDASFYPIGNIWPLVAHVAKHGLYAKPDGFTIGQWASDKALDAFGFMGRRDDALKIPGYMSGCVGFDTRQRKVRALIEEWAAPENVALIPGPHSNTGNADKRFGERNPGWCSDSQQCYGHRQDQTTLSLLIDRLKIAPATGEFWRYASEGPSADTVLLCQGGM